MKKYYIDESVKYCYPGDVSRNTNNYGVLAPYMGRELSREEADRAICEMVMSHPYVKGAIDLKVTVMWKEDGARGYYHMLEFRNEDYDRQKKGSLEIRYEKEPLREMEEERNL